MAEEDSNEEAEEEEKRKSYKVEVSIRGRGKRKFDCYIEKPRAERKDKGIVPEDVSHNKLYNALNDQISVILEHFGEDYRIINFSDEGRIGETAEYGLKYVDEKGRLVLKEHGNARTRYLSVESIDEEVAVCDFIRLAKRHYDPIYKATTTRHGDLRKVDVFEDEIDPDWLDKIEVLYHRAEAESAKHRS